MARRMTPAAFACALFVALVLAPASAASAKGLHISVTDTTYTITGSTAQELRDDMVAKGPYPWFGETTDQVDDHFRTTVLRNGNCAATKVRVDVAVTYLLPSWTPPAGVDQALVDKFETFLAGLTIHERGHGRIAIRGARKMLKAMQAVKPQPTCAKVGKAVTKVTKARIKKIQEREAAYDVRTQHGITQGASFDV